jgi:uncharacterized membrane protein YeiB
MVYVNYEVVLAFGVKEPFWMRSLASAFEGRASALFVMLAGIGLTMLNCPRSIFRRGVFLLVFGYLWQVVWPGDILHFYAFYLFAGAAVLKCSAKALLFFALLVTLGFLAMFNLLDYGAGWDWLNLEYTSFWEPSGQIRNLFFNGWHPLFPWLAFLFVGMALGKWGIAEEKKCRKALLWSAIVFLVVSVASNFLSQLEDNRPPFEKIDFWYKSPESLFGTDSLPPVPGYVISAGASSVFIMAICLELGRREILKKYLQPLVVTGQFALSLYIAHILFLYGGDLNPSPGTELSTAGWRALYFCVFALLFANLWPRRWRKGPLEYLMRLTTKPDKAR